MKITSQSRQLVKRLKNEDGQIPSQRDIIQVDAQGMVSQRGKKNLPKKENKN